MAAIETAVQHVADQIGNLAMAVERLASNIDVDDINLAVIACIAAGLHAGNEDMPADTAAKLAVETLMAIRRRSG